MERLDTLAAFVSMLATSARLVDELAVRARSLGAGRVVVVGLSLDGWVANLHRAYLGGADVYVPMLAGTALDELFLSSAYRRMTGRNALVNPGPVRTALNFERDYALVPEPNVRPILARHDRLVDYTRASGAYAAHPLRTLDKGHALAAITCMKLRQHVELALT